MNQVIEMILNHRSIRKFKNEPLTKETVQMIVKSAQAASTSSYIQAYSIIGVTDQRKKKHLAELSGQQSHVVQNVIFLFSVLIYYVMK